MNPNMGMKRLPTSRMTSMRTMARTKSPSKAGLRPTMRKPTLRDMGR